MDSETTKGDEIPANDEVASEVASETNSEVAKIESDALTKDVAAPPDTNPEKETAENVQVEDNKKQTEGKPSEESASEDSANEIKEPPKVEIPKKSTEKGEPVKDPSADLSMPPKQTLGKGKRARIPNKRYSDIILSPTPRSYRAHLENGDKTVKPDKGENENDFNTREDELANLPDIASMKSRADTSSPAAKRAKVAADINDPRFKKPISQGWKRELVYRAANNNPNKRDGDIYYYTPEGKKLRSMREISESLKDYKDLKMDNFTFLKEPLGLNDPDKEIIREAKVWPKKTSTRGGTRTPKVISPKAGSPKTPGTPKAATPKVSSPRTSYAPETDSPSGTRTRTKASLGGIKNSQIKLPPVKGKTDKKSKIEDESMEVDSPLPKRAAAKKAPTKLTSVEMEGKPCQPCSIRCQGVSGMVPTLQCRLCLCLYHYECVGLSPHILIQDYVCKNCRLEHGQSVTSSASIILPPLTPIDPSSVLPPLQRIPLSGDSPQHDVATPGSTSINMPRLHPLPKLAKDAPSQAPLLRLNNQQQNITETKNLVGSVTSWLPHTTTLQVDNMRNKENEPLEAPRPQYVEYLAGRKFLIIPKHNVVSVSPANVQVKSNDTNSGDNSENCHKNGHVNSSGMVETQTSENKEETQGDEEMPETDTTRGNKRGTRANNITSNEKFEEHKPMDSYLQNLSYGYNTLLYVFQYLKVQDLLRAGCVCTMWRDIASHWSLWRTVRMKNSQVHSFEGLANSLQRQGTVHLDLRKMLLPTNATDEIWPEFSKAIQKVQTLRKIELCRCPASVVEQLALTNQDLEVINAVSIKCESISLSVLSSLKNLKELRLKSPSGLSLSSDITSLKELTNLTHLSLTSVKDLNKMDLQVMAALTNLESLDLGECSDFPASFGEEILSKLKNLEKLRLEKGQGNCHTFEMLGAVKDMPKLDQLELVNFDIKLGFDVALGGCSNIKKLLIIPTYISQSATTNHMVLGGVLRLQSTLSHFVWGVTLELLRVTELFVDQCEDPDKKEKKEKKPTGNGDSIPVLKPVPLITDKDDSIAPAHDPPQVEILPLPNLQKLLLHSLPTTKIKILKIPFHATWRQSITDTVN